MFEAVRRLWLGIVLIAAASAFLLLSDARQRTGAVPRAAILQFSSMGVLDEGARGLTDYLKEHGYDGQHKVLIDRFNAENDVATSSAMAKEITSGSGGEIEVTSRRGSKFQLGSGAAGGARPRGMRRPSRAISACTSRVRR